jgi:single-stranded-DNA-specific exonuclease
MHARWTLTETDSDAATALSRALGVSPLVARLLVNRGYRDAGSAQRFLEPKLAHLDSPLLLRGMSAAVARILAAHDRGELITVWGDYDVDGVTSTTLLLRFFRDVGIRASYFIPDRFVDGYGLSAPRLEELAAAGTRLVITVDCGVSNAAEVAHARAHGLDVIIVDHHLPPEELPAAVALVNPLQPGCEFPYKKMAAVGLTFHLLMALRASLRERGAFRGRAEPDLRDYLDIAAIGTIADVVPLTGTNRVLTWNGLPRVVHSKSHGVRALCHVSGAGNRPVSAGTVGFQIGPRINAAGRLSSATKGVEMLTAESYEAALAIAEEVDRENQARRAIERRILDEAVDAVLAAGDPEGRRAFVLAREGWHAGVVGIVASKVVERFHRPTVVIAVEDGVGKGSGRSVEGFHMVDGLAGCAEDLVGFGGHAHAAGLTVAQPRIERFAERFEGIARHTLRDEHLMPTLRLDAELPLGHVTWDLLADLERLAPYGQGNPRPTFLARGVRVVRSQVLKGEHLKLLVEQGGATLDCIAFRMGDRAPEPGALLDLAFRPEINEFQGSRRLQLQARDLRPAA